MRGSPWLAAGHWLSVCPRSTDKGAQRTSTVSANTTCADRLLSFWGLEFGRVLGREHLHDQPRIKNLGTRSLMSPQ